MKQYNILTLLTLVLILAVGCGPVAEEESTEEKVEQAVPVALVPVQPMLKSIAIQSSGVVGSRKEVKLSFKVGGVIQAVYANEGEFVKKGQLVAKLNTQEIDAQVLQAEAGLEKAKRDLQRINQLYEDTVATLEQVQDLTTAKDVAAANLNIARFNKKYAEIYAPSDGRILKQFAERGEIISPGSPVYLLAAADQSQVIRVGISDKDVVKISLGDEAEVQFDALPGARVDARVSEIAAGANPSNGTFEIELALDSKDLPIKNGFVGKVKLFPKVESGKVQIPLSTLVEADPNHATLYSLDSSGQFAKQLTLKNYELGDSFLIVPADQLKGVKEVISEGARYLGPHTAVQVQKETPSTITQK